MADREVSREYRDDAATWETCHVEVVRSRDEGSRRFVELSYLVQDSIAACLGSCDADHTVGKASF